MTSSPAAPLRIAGVLLAAGMGRRFGGPKALADTGSGPWVLRALATLDSLTERVVVVGAAADKVAALLPSGVSIATNPDFESGMGSSLAAGLRALASNASQITPGVDAAVVMLVDLPDVPAAAVQRVVAHVRETAGPEGDVIPGVRQALARATYRGKAGHPVLIGADHFAGVIASATGDHGARDYLATRVVMEVECGDLAGGEDVDRSPGEA